MVDEMNIVELAFDEIDSVSGGLGCRDEVVMLCDGSGECTPTTMVVCRP